MSLSTSQQRLGNSWNPGNYLLPSVGRRHGSLATVLLLLCTVDWPADFMLACERLQLLKCIQCSSSADRFKTHVHCTFPPTTNHWPATRPRLTVGRGQRALERERHIRTGGCDGYLLKRLIIGGMQWMCCTLRSRKSFIRTSHPPVHLTFIHSDIGPSVLVFTRVKGSQVMANPCSFRLSAFNYVREIHARSP